MSFPVDILYPVSDYWGIAKASRAALGQMQIIREHALIDDILFHEFGHLAYYRKMLGATIYNQHHACNFSTTCVSFPSCGGCIGHQWNENVGPEAAMIEGWADFFEEMTMRAINSRVGFFSFLETPHSVITSPTGPGVETWVAAYLWDIWDYVEETENPPQQDDDLLTAEGTFQQNYKRLADYMTNLPLSSELANIWASRIKPSLNATQRTNHCSNLRLNTLASIDGSCL